MILSLFLFLFTDGHPTSKVGLRLMDIPHAKGGHGSRASFSEDDHSTIKFRTP
jgi:hypothetical protein